MHKTKLIGTISVEDIDRYSKNWDPVVLESSPFGVVTEPDGFMWSFGSANSSLATTSAEGFTYIADTNLFRVGDSNVVKVDRYIGSSTSDSVHIYKIDNGLIGYHHLKIGDEIFGRLPDPYQSVIRDLLKNK